MQLYVRGQQTHVLEVQPSETIEVIKVSCRKIFLYETSQVGKKDPAIVQTMLLIKQWTRLWSFLYLLEKFDYLYEEFH